MAKTRCPRCGGSGKLPQFEHYAKGICFQCMGTGEVKDTGAMPYANEEHVPAEYEDSPNDVCEWIEEWDNNRRMCGVGT